MPSFSRNRKLNTRSPTQLHHGFANIIYQRRLPGGAPCYLFFVRGHKTSRLLAKRQYSGFITKTGYYLTIGIMKINVLTLSGSKFQVEVRNGATVEDLIHQVARSQQVSFDQIRLLFNGKPMSENQRTVASYDIKEGFTIHMVTDSKVQIRVTVDDMPDGRSQVFTVDSNELVDVLKNKIIESARFKVDCSLMQLSFEGKLVQGGRISHFGIRDGSKLKLKLQDIQVTVKKMDGKRLTMRVSYSETVEQFQSRLYQETNVPVSQQRLICNGRQLGTGRMVDYELRSGSVIDMVGRLRGG